MGEVETTETYRVLQNARLPGLGTIGKIKVDGKRSNDGNHENVGSACC
jgi:hypothetical protein